MGTPEARHSGGREKACTSSRARDEESGAEIAEEGGIRGRRGGSGTRRMMLDESRPSLWTEWRSLLSQALQQHMRLRWVLSCWCCL
eukprot:1057693-Amphidinium_carterae.2